MDYRLLELAAGGPNRADPAFLATLLSPLALSPDPLDYLFPWMLLQSLQAIGAIPDTASADEVCPHAASWLNSIVNDIFHVALPLAHSSTFCCCQSCSSVSMQSLCLLLVNPCYLSNDAL